MCLSSSRYRRFSGLLSLLACCIAIYVGFFQERTANCVPTSSTLPGRHLARPSPQGAPPLAPVNISALPPGPTAAPALSACELPLDVMAPTQRPTPTPFPTLRPVPSSLPGEAEITAMRAAALRRHTSQCFQVISDQLANASARLVYCEDFARAVQDGHREFRDGPFYTRCPAVWFTPGEACALLKIIGKMIVFVGDSIGRQVQQGLFTVLTGS